jgi:hypothetical protein
MKRLTEAIFQKAAMLPERVSITAKMLLHLGSRAALDEALSRRKPFWSRALSAQKVVKEPSINERRR